MLDHALALAGHGLRVFRLQPEAKEPAAGSTGFFDKATADPDILRAWWTSAVGGDIEANNVAVLTGNGIMVVDVDAKGADPDARIGLLEMEYDELPKTWSVDTPRGGRHLYFRLPDGVTVPGSQSQLGEAIDVRGFHNYVAAPGSETSDGIYRWHTGLAPADVPLAEAPAWLLDACRSAPASSMAASRPPAHAVCELDTPEAIDRARDWLSTAAPEAIEGQAGRSTTMRVIHKLGDIGLSPIGVLELLTEDGGWNEGRATPPWEIDDLERLTVDMLTKHRDQPLGCDFQVFAASEFEIVPLAATEPTADKARTRWHFQLASAVADSALAETPSPLVEGLLEQGSLSVLYGPSNVGKTFLALDMSHAIAAGKPWGGRAVQQGLVVYLAAEGGRGIHKRFRALQKQNGFDADLPLVLVQVAADLLHDDKDVRHLINEVRAAEAETRQRCSLLVIDTLSRVLAGGDENSSIDMGKLVQNFDRVRSVLRCHLMAVHHTGKNTDRGARGWSGLRAAIDTEIEVRDGAFEVTKQRDMDFARPTAFALKSIDIGLDANGAPVNSAVVVLGVGAEMDGAAVDLTSKEEEMYDAFMAAIEAKYSDTEGDDGAERSVSTSDWYSKMTENAFRHGSSSGTSRQNLDGLRRGLTEKGWVRRHKQNQWVTAGDGK